MAAPDISHGVIAGKKLAHVVTRIANESDVLMQPCRGVVLKKKRGTPETRLQWRRQRGGGRGKLPLMGVRKDR